ncbi:hypothetical protein HDU96_001515 [Phlyctochytrium bullatum]|nr:hypothetical protein HDU96_001515 [Phlyctochytrium bullatum]
MTQDEQAAVLENIREAKAAEAARKRGKAKETDLQPQAPGPQAPCQCLICGELCRSAAFAQCEERRYHPYLNRDLCITSLYKGLTAIPVAGGTQGNLVKMVSFRLSSPFVLFVNQIAEAKTM